MTYSNVIPPAMRAKLLALYNARNGTDYTMADLGNMLIDIQLGALKSEVQQRVMYKTITDDQVGTETDTATAEAIAAKKTTTTS